MVEENITEFVFFQTASGLPGFGIHHNLVISAILANAAKRSVEMPEEQVRQ